MIGVANAPAERASDFDLSHYVALRGLAERDEVTRLLDHGGWAILELCGGAGWGKSSAAITYAAQRQRTGTEVIVFESDGAVRICPAPAHGDMLYLVDDVDLSPDVTEELLRRVQEDSRVQILVCSRERHPLVRSALSIGLVARRIDLSDHRLSADDLQAIARLRGVHLETQRAQYAAHAAGGWPVVATGFIDLYADGAGDTSVRSIDHLITRSFETVLNRMLGAGALPLLARAALGDGIRPDAPEGSTTERRALNGLIDRVRRLGLGKWVMP